VTIAVSVELSFNVLKVRFGATTHVRIDVTRLLGYQSWREGYGNRKFVIEYTLAGGGPIVCEYDDVAKWQAILAGLDQALDQPNRTVIA
jgi:hypothetical protein